MSRIKGDIYEITCEGQYYGFTNGQKSIKPYTLKWRGDDNVKKQGFLSAFRNALTPKDGESTALLNKMKELYPDYKRFRTHTVIEVINLSQRNKPVREIQLMNRAQIVNFINKKGLPVDTELYPSVTDMRQALKDYRENPEAFEKNQEKRRVTKGPNLAVQRSIEILNSPDYKNDPETQVPDDLSTQTPPTGSTTKSRNKKPPTPSTAQNKPAYRPGEPVQEELIHIEDATGDDLDEMDDPEGITMFDDEDELDELLQGV